MKPPYYLHKHLLNVSVIGLTALSGRKTYYHAVTEPITPATLDVRRFSLGTFVHEYDHVLGTSMELLVRTAHPFEARECEWRVLEEIEHLRHILSTYDPASEICRVMGGAPVVSDKLADLLATYAQWQERTGGALNATMGEVIGLWKDAARTGTPPSTGALRRAALSRAYNVDALGKGFIIDRAVEVARRFAPAGLLNIGGDIRVWGGDAWRIGVADPLAPADNAPPLAEFYLREGAIATSGGYARQFTVGEKKYSHILDPRTLRPTANSLSATVVAPDCVTANALSTAACVVGAQLGVQFSRQWGVLEHLIVDRAGEVLRTGGFVAVAIPAPVSIPPALRVPPPAPSEKSISAPVSTAEKPASDTSTAEKSPEKSATPWPKDFQLALNITLKTPDMTARRGVRRPYVVVWVENADHKYVRTLIVWGSSGRYLSSLSEWWNASVHADHSVIRSVTRATRAPGEYAVVWDGLDEKGQPVPMGEYKIFVEINREHGRHVTENASITCGAEGQTAELRATLESDTSKITYGFTSGKKSAGAKTPETLAAAIVNK